MNDEDTVSRWRPFYVDPQQSQLGYSDDGNCAGIKIISSASVAVKVDSAPF